MAPRANTAIAAPAASVSVDEQKVFAYTEAVRSGDPDAAATEAPCPRQVPWPKHRTQHFAFLDRRSALIPLGFEVTLGDRKPPACHGGNCYDTASRMVPKHLISCLSSPSTPMDDGPELLA